MEPQITSHALARLRQRFDITDPLAIKDIKFMSFDSQQYTIVCQDDDTETRRIKYDFKTIDVVVNPYLRLVITAKPKNGNARAINPTVGEILRRIEDLETNQTGIMHTIKPKKDEPMKTETTITMNTKDIAKALDRSVRTVQDWVKLAGAKSAQVDAKSAQAKATCKPAEFSIDDVCLIIEEGLGKGAADSFRTNAVFAESEKRAKVDSRAKRLPCGTQLNALIKMYGAHEAARRVDFVIGYSTKPKITMQIESHGEIPDDATAQLMFDEMRSKWGNKESAE